VASRRRHLIVGAGTSGCTLAARLVELTDDEVIVLEAGDDLRPGTDPIVDGCNVIDASAHPTRTVTDRVAGRSYARGQTVGGSSAVNGQIAMWPTGDDLAEWGQLGQEWSARALQPAIAAVRRILTTSTPSTSTWSSLHRAVAESALRLAFPWRAHATGQRGVGPVRLTRTAADGTRWSAATLLDDARMTAGARLDVRSHCTVTSIGASTRDAHRSVELADGTAIVGDTITICAGAIDTPMLLQRSGLDGAAGTGLQDHPSIAFNAIWGNARTHAQYAHDDIDDPIRCIVSTGDAQILPLPHDPRAGAGRPDVIAVGLMRVTSRGWVDQDTAHLAVLHDDRDADALLDAVSLAARLIDLRNGPDGDLVRSILDDADLNERRRALRSAVTVSPGPYVHAASGCANTHLPAGVRVADLSLLPSVPSANPMISALIIGAHIAELISREPT
jgi:hypothetical protein